MIQGIIKGNNFEIIKVPKSQDRGTPKKIQDKGQPRVKSGSPVRDISYNEFQARRNQFKIEDSLEYNDRLLVHNKYNSKLVDSEVYDSRKFREDTELYNNSHDLMQPLVDLKSRYDTNTKFPSSNKNFELNSNNSEMIDSYANEDKLKFVKEVTSIFEEQLFKNVRKHFKSQTPKNHNKRSKHMVGIHESPEFVSSFKKSKHK